MKTDLWLGAALGVMLMAVAGCASGAVEDQQAVFSALYGDLELVDEIDCATDQTHSFKDYPAGVSSVETILGRPARVLPNTGASKSFSYLVGKDKGLKAGDMYVLVVEYPEDQPRAFTISNKGNESNLGVATGRTAGDALASMYVGSNPEVIDYPLSGKWEATKAMFNLHDMTAEDEQALKRGGNSKRTRKPEDGFWVSIAQFGASGDPLSAGAAVSRISLYKVVDPAKTVVKANYPPAELPRRHLFWREEMGDMMIGGVDGSENRGLVKAVDYYRNKVNLIRFLGMNTYCQDMLEFGHNQGWDSAPYGGNNWYYQTKYPERWSQILDMLSRHRDLDVLCYYEYAGSIGGDKELAIGAQCRALNINGEKKYTHIGWSGAPKCNADLADPVFIDDVQKLLDATQNMHKDKVTFLGAWFRPRMEQNPISFNDFDIALYNKEMEKSVTRESLDADPAALKNYVEWFLGKRKVFLTAARDYLRTNVNPDAKVFYTTDPTEPGHGMGGYANAVVTDDPAAWRKDLRSPKIAAALKANGKWGEQAQKYRVIAASDEVCTYPGKALQEYWPTWGKWRWDLGVPYADPANYKDTDGINMSYTFNRLYTVGDPGSLDAFRSRDGLLMVRHYSLNENNLHGSDGKEILGYYCAQFDRGGKYSMLAEARALINGDPRYIGYLTPMNYGRLFPEYTRAFNLAFLALPAVPSVKLDNCSSNPDIGVREYKTDKYGTYYAVADIGLNDAEGVRVKLPAQGTVTDLVTGKIIPSEAGVITLDFYSGQVYALNVK